MVRDPGKSWKSRNINNQVLLKDIEKQQDKKIWQLKKWLMYIRHPGKKLSDAWESPENLFLKKLCTLDDDDWFSFSSISVNNWGPPPALNEPVVKI